MTPNGDGGDDVHNDVDDSDGNDGCSGGDHDVGSDHDVGCHQASVGLDLGGCPVAYPLPYGENLGETEVVTIVLVHIIIVITTIINTVVKMDTIQLCLKPSFTILLSTYQATLVPP